MLAPHTLARLAVFETDGPEPQSPSRLAWALLASLYLDNVICLDFEDLRTILPGASIARWYRQGESIKRLRVEPARITVHGEAIGIFCGVVAEEIEEWEAAGACPLSWCPPV